MENNPLSLIIREKTLGSLITNAKDIKAYVAKKIEEYSVDNYQGDAKQAAQDKAELNNAAKQLNSRRIDLEKEWNMPFQEFKSIIADTVEMITTASQKLDVIVKAKEAEEKAEKKAEIEKMWESKNFNLITLDRIFDKRWLNKGTKLSVIDSELDSAIKKITGDLDSLDAFGSDTSILKDLYLSTLNLQQTLNKGAELKANRERLAQLEAEKKAREEAAKAAARKAVVEVESEEPIQVSFKKAENIESEPEKELVQEQEKEPVQSRDINKSYLFNVYGNEKDVSVISAIADELGLDIIPSVMIQGNVRQIGTFKTLLADNGLKYDKSAIINLAVKRT